MIVCAPKRRSMLVCFVPFLPKLLILSVVTLPHQQHPALIPFLRHKRGGSGALVPPSRRQDTDGLVVAGEAVDTGLDENLPTSKISILPK